MGFLNKIFDHCELTEEEREHFLKRNMLPSDTPDAYKGKKSDDQIDVGFTTAAEVISEWASGDDTPDDHSLDSLQYASVDGLGQEKVFEASVAELEEISREAKGMSVDISDLGIETHVVSGAQFHLQCKQQYHKQKTLNKYYSLMSEENENIEVNMEGEQKVLTIRRGVAPEPNDPEPVRISGHIDAPERYFKKRAGKTFPKENAHLEVDTQNKKIHLYCDPSDILAPVITGRINRYEPLMNLRINDGEFSKDGLKLILKKHRFLFKKSSDCSELVNNLENLEMKIDRELENKDDSRGNRSLVVKQTVQAEIPETITLESQIFVEGDKHEIVCDVCYDVNSGGDLKFWLESDSLYEMVEEQTKQMISDTVSEFGDEIVIIYQ